MGVYRGFTSIGREGGKNDQCKKPGNTPLFFRII
jgi:hypothetical protein